MYEIVRVGDVSLLDNIVNVLSKTDYFSNYLELPKCNDIWLNCLHIAISLQYYDFIEYILDLCKNQLQLSKDIFLALIDVHGSCEFENPTAITQNKNDEWKESLDSENNYCNCFDAFSKLLEYKKQHFESNSYEKLILNSKVFDKIIISGYNKFFYLITTAVNKNSLIDFITKQKYNDGNGFFGPRYFWVVNWFWDFT